MRPKENIHKISRAELESLSFPPETGMVMVHVPYRNRDERTDSGIYVVTDEDFNPVVHAERWGYIYKISESLFYDRTDPATMLWKTEIEVEVGDKVWFDFRTALFSYTYECEGEMYKIMGYQSMYLAERGKKKIPLNGYILFSEVDEELESEFLLSAEVDKRFGVVEYAGSYNQEYAISIYNDAIIVKKGDHVLFEKGTACFPLESGMHNEFSDKRYVLQQRKRIIAVVDKEHKNIIRLHDGVIGIKTKEVDLTKGEIKLLKDGKNYRIGSVVISSHSDISKGDTVLLSKGGGTVFNGIEYLIEDKILYYETPG